MMINGVGAVNYPAKITGIAKAGTVSQTAAANKTAAAGECQTCENRKYRCGNGTPENVDASTSFSQVMSHERAHLTEQRHKAEQKDMEVASTKIKIEYAHCPECGRIYAEGGEAVTTMVKKSDQKPEGLGNQVDFTA